MFTTAPYSLLSKQQPMRSGENLSQMSLLYSKCSMAPPHLEWKPTFLLCLPKPQHLVPGSYLSSICPSLCFSLTGHAAQPPTTYLSCLWSVFDFPGGSDGKASAYNTGDLGSIPGLGRSPGEGNGNPLQYSCLENPMDGGTW